VEIWLSRETGGVWSPPVAVANGIQYQGKRYPCWNPVLYRAPEGPLFLYYKAGPDPEAWWGMFMHSDDDGRTWGEPCRLPEDILGPVRNKPVRLDDGRLLCPSSTEHEGWQVHLEITSDLGKTWQRIGPLNDSAAHQVIQPSILTYSDGRLQLLCRGKESRIISSWSEDGGYSWSLLSPIHLPNPNSGIDAVTLRDGRQLLVYNHAEKVSGEWGGPRSPLNVALSDDGVNWRPTLVLEDQPGEYSYPAVIQAPDGKVHIVYTYQRKHIQHVVVDPDLL
jgi:predicted neuraminidase